MPAPPADASLPTDALQEAIVAEFSALESWDARYRHLIELGRRLPAFPQTLHDDNHLVRGCQSQVWMHVTLSDQGYIQLIADSDALIVRGLVALLLRIYSDQTPETILATRPTFIERIEMSRHISMQRANGLAAMIKQIQLYALAFQLQRAQQGS
ncbi:MAG: SufE family protein [Vampirovibrionales bacterium]|nr:SufE family protein [Vampirovibrionales bacterium]